MIPKNKRSKFLQKELNENNFSIAYDFIKKIKGLDSTAKLLLIEMCNDTYMNGKVTWAQNTYADRIGITRRQIMRWFKKFTDVGILVPDAENKVGSKNNTHSLIPSKIHKLTKPVTPEVPTCDAEGTQPVTPEVPTCDADVTYNKINKSNKDLLIEEEDVLDVSSSKRTGPSDIELFKFAQNLDIDI